jgi:hypothetical protein
MSLLALAVIVVLLAGIAFVFQKPLAPLLLNHIVPPLPLRFAYPAFLGDAAKHFDGPITVGDDGMLFSLPANSTTSERKRLH